MKGSGTSRQHHSQAPSPTTTINVRDDQGGTRSKQVSAYRDSQDRSYLKPHQGKKEKARRLRQKDEANG